MDKNNDSEYKRERKIKEPLQFLITAALQVISERNFC